MAQTEIKIALQTDKDLKGEILTGIGSPSGNSDAANKEYVGI